LIIYQSLQNAYSYLTLTLIPTLTLSSTLTPLGYWEDPETGWIEGAAIFIAVGLVRI
jgi:hypothetical protein